MNKTIFIFLLAAAACARSGKDEHIELLEPREAANQLQSNPGIMIIDVRTQAETQSGVIAGAKNLDYNSPEFQNSLDTLDRGKTYLLYCASGARSGKAQQLMKEQGFEHILSVDGGLRAWVAAGLPVNKP